MQTVPMDDWDWIELTFAATTDPVGIGPGVPLVVSRVVPEPVRAQSCIC